MVFVELTVGLTMEVFLLNYGSKIHVVAISFGQFHQQLRFFRFFIFIFLYLYETCKNSFVRVFSRHGLMGHLDGAPVCVCVDCSFDHMNGGEITLTVHITV